MNYEIISLADCPEIKSRAAQWFHEKWDIPAEAYEESMPERRICSSSVVCGNGGG